MKLNLFKKVCLTVMGVGVISSLVSVGTFATFTATTTNPGNTFAAGTLKISTSGDTSVNTSGNTNVINTAANVNSTGNTQGTGATDFGAGSTCTNVIASACGYLVKTTNVTSEGIEPGQWVSGHITIVNNGTLPALMAVNFQQMFSNSGTTNSNCPTDATANNAGVTPATACVPLGGGLNITIHDDSTTGYAGGQCIYGSNSSTASPTADKVAVTGACDPITNAANLTPGTVQAAADPFGVVGTSGLGQYNGSGVAGTLIYIGGNDSTTVTIGSTPGTAVKRWAPGESHTFTVTMALPDQGTVSGSIAGGNGGNDTVTVGADTKYQGGSVGFDMVWLAVQ